MKAHRTYRPFVPLLLGALLSGPGCAHIKEVYYLMARDQKTQTTNIYRISVSGTSSASQTKYSTGFYDRDSVERLFSENRLQREYLATQVKMFDDAGKRIYNLADQLAHVDQEDLAVQISRLESINASIAGLRGRYAARFGSNDRLAVAKAEGAGQDPAAPPAVRPAPANAPSVPAAPADKNAKKDEKIKSRTGSTPPAAPAPSAAPSSTSGDISPTFYVQRLEDIRLAQEEAKDALDKARQCRVGTSDTPACLAQDGKTLLQGDARGQQAHTKVAAAEAKLRYALWQVNAIRMNLEGSSQVRFFDAAGNELDVDNKKMVIFVASDVSRFSEAIRQLAEADETRGSILSTLQGKQIQEAASLTQQVERSDRVERERMRRLDEMAAGLSTAKDAKALTAALLNMASVTADKVFQDANEIRGYVRGRQ